MKNKLEFTITQLLEEDYCLRHHHNKPYIHAKIYNYSNIDINIHTSTVQ